MSTADVSVVIPYFNMRDCMERCLLSVAAQTLPVREVIVVDDGSIEPFRLPAGLPADFAARVSMLRVHENRGAAAARNVGVQHATGKYIAFLDADDVWLPEKIEVQYGMMERHGCAMSGHGYAFTGLAMAAEAAHPARHGLRPVSRLDFVLGNPYFTPTVMVLRQGFRPFDEAFRRTDDYKAWLENFEPGGAVLIPRVLAHGFKLAIGHSGLSGSIVLMHRSFVQVLASLRAEGKVSLPFYLATTVVEYLKLPLRFLRVAWVRSRNRT